jgi:hypothetical protein
MKKSTLFASFLALSFSIPIYAQTITTIAGNGTAGYSGDGGQATAAEINVPIPLAVDGAGNIYINDTFNYRIRKVNTSGVISTIAGNGSSGFSGDGGPATAAELNFPRGIDVDGAGNIYISDQSNHRVRMVNTSGFINTIVGNGTSGFSGDGGQATAAELASPGYLAIDGTGNLYIADYGSQSVRIVNTSGIINLYAGNGTAGFSGDGGQATAAELNTPVGLAIDGANNLYITDYTNYRIRKVDNTGIMSTFAGTGTNGFSGDGGQATAAKISNCQGLCLDGVGNVYIADYANARIRIVIPSGVINTIAGNGTVGFSGDGGPATAAELSSPTDVALDASGNLYVVDAGNNRIRKVTGIPQGISQINFVKEDIYIYPNPSNGVFTLNSEKLKVNCVVELYNVLGEKVYTSGFLSPNSQFLIDISNQPSGIYVYRIIAETGGLVSCGKLVIDK